MGDEPPRKVARTSSVHARLPFISGAALSAVLEFVKKNEIPEATSKRSLTRTRDSDCKQNTPYGQLRQTLSVETLNGRAATLEIQHPLAMLYHACATSACWARKFDLLAQSSSPTSPLNIIMYCDEVSPGNPLAITQDRKFWCFYWSIQELGMSALSCEELHHIAQIPPLTHAHTTHAFTPKLHVSSCACPWLQPCAQIITRVPHFTCKATVHLPTSLPSRHAYRRRGSSC